MCSGTVRTICSSTSPAGSDGATGASCSPFTSCQRMRKCSATSATAGPSIRAAASCQPIARARRVMARVESVAGLRGEVDAADERDAVVDHDRLLVMAMHRPLLRVERALDARVLRQAVPHLAHLATRRPEERQRRSGPDEHAHVDALGQLGEEVAQDDRLVAAHELEVRREVPVRHVNVRARRTQLARHHRAARRRRRSGSRLRCRAAAQAPRRPSRLQRRRARAPSRSGEAAGGGGARSGPRSPRRAGIQPTRSASRRRGIQILR